MLLYSLVSMPRPAFHRLWGEPGNEAILWQCIYIVAICHIVTIHPYIVTSLHIVTMSFFILWQYLYIVTGFLYCGNKSFYCDNVSLYCGNKSLYCGNKSLRWGNVFIIIVTIFLYCGNMTKSGLVSRLIVVHHNIWHFMHVHVYNLVSFSGPVWEWDYKPLW